MTQLEQAPRRAITLSAGIVALAAAVVIAVTIVLGMLIPGRVSFPITEQDHGNSAPNPALVQAEGEWQRQREQQGGYVDPLTQAERNWEQQREQQSPFDIGLANLSNETAGSDAATTAGSAAGMDWTQAERPGQAAAATSADRGDGPDAPARGGAPTPE